VDIVWTIRDAGHAGLLIHLCKRSVCPLTGQSLETCRSVTRRETLECLPAGDGGDTPVRHEHGDRSLRLERRDGEWLLAGSDAKRFGLVNEYLSHLADRNYSPRTVRAYGFDFLAFCRWLRNEGIDLAAVTTDVLLRFLAACREARVPGRPGPNVVSLGGRRLDQYAAATINHRLIAISGLFAFRAMRDPDAPNPVPKGREARRAAGERGGPAGACRPAAEDPLAVAAARAETAAAGPGPAAGC
jgi:integrase/recombinase XerD